MVKAKPKVTPHQLTQQQAAIGDIYGHLEQELFEMFVDRLKAKGVNDLDETHVMQWQLEKLNDLHLVNQDTTKAVVKATGIAQKQLEELITKAGYDVASDEYKRIGDAIGHRKEPSNLTKQLLDGYLKQTFLGLDNNVNQTLITTNLGESAATQTFQGIVKDIAAEVVTGIKAPERAMQDTIYKWRQAGIPSGFVDKGGHKWSIDTYARTVIDTTSARAFQAVRDEAANDYGIDTFVMSAHPASRAACAPIQGRTVTTRLHSFDDPQTGEHFEALVAHGYGTPGGTFGINCHHIKWAYISGVNENTQPQYDPQEAIAKGNIQQQQRALERRVRSYKNELALAQKMGDQKGIAHYSQLIRDNQSALRQLVRQHDFLSRDYAREKYYGGFAGKLKAPAAPKKRNYRDFDQAALDANNDYIQKLPEDQRDALHKYTLGAFYKRINSSLRYGVTVSDTVNEVEENLHKALQHSLGIDTHAYRGLHGIPSEWLKGLDPATRDSIQKTANAAAVGIEKAKVPAVNAALSMLPSFEVMDPAYMSTTHEERVTQGFSTNIRLDLKVPSETHAVAIENVSEFDFEKEILIDKGARIKVTGIKVSDNGMTVILKGEVANGSDQES